MAASQIPVQTLARHGVLHGHDISMELKVSSFDILYPAQGSWQSLIHMLLLLLVLALLAQGFPFTPTHTAQFPAVLCTFQL